MSEIIKSYLNNLQNKPSFPKYKSFQWADYIELLCLANIDGQISKNDIIARLIEREIDLQESDADDLEEIQYLEKEDNEKPTRRSEISDTWETHLTDWFKVLKVREALYNSYYPFQITETEIKRKLESLSHHQTVYLYLLFCSNLYLFDKSTQTNLASSFELISHSSFKNILPSGAEVHLFGSNPLNNGRYGSLPLLDKIKKLSQDLNETLDPRLNEGNYPTTNRGDGGLDIVGWLPTGDKLPSSLIFFAQCACTQEWVSKQDDSSHNTWRGKILFKNFINNTIFIPFCFRRADGSWAKIEDIKQSFLVDRKRLLHYYFQKEFNSFDSLPAFEVVKQVTNAREEVI